ncbi:hypothetical protein KZX37_01160 [Microbacterium sp. EYE_5]|uniref:hypothetical protein n=1 Tax=unclassified Microbacterium TaxID=2609290 RepID=UPI00200388E1|nr:MULTISPECIES: hypothetical protein [unclassified Microbacterium]MCK6079225.1 hypothetical protein [Microbacterium sp. EYE_382]MCK6084495.1 hypothetical protein [Microbacterium sp. EYE_384]MCK6123276.1 hypothetical protein [Microbacterium sp. EYE_80]MCK6125259.1 hypothetical protein [Microbacterium sp. EYE_79]MCK6140179.1 hypothetical protein [Microbacterium sp. EYE_39]
MVTLLLDSTRLEIALSFTERALSFRKDDVRVDRAHIRKVQLVDDPWTWLRGVPTPGTVVPRTIAMGVWRSAGGDDFVLVRRSRPSVVIDLEGDPEFQRLVLTTRHGLALVQALQLDVDDREPVDVVELATTEIPVVPAASPEATGRPGRRRAPRPAQA